MFREGLKCGFGVSGSTLGFQPKSRSSSLLTRSKIGQLYREDEPSNSKRFGRIGPKPTRIAEKSGRYDFRCPIFIANMTDNLNIKGILDDEPLRRGKKRHGRKPFVLQTRFLPGPKYRRSLYSDWGWNHWHTYSRYYIESARDQAYAALVKKAENDRFRDWSRQEFRKHDD